VTLRSSLRASARALAFAVWTGALFSAHLLGRALLPARVARRWLAALQRRWARGTLRILGARVQIEGEPPRAPFFLVANHLSYVDVALLHAFAPCSFVVKSEVARWPVFGWLTRATGHVFVRRERRRDLPRVIAELEQRLAQGCGATVFAEATSSAGSSVLPFRSPLFAVAARGAWPVHCVALSYRMPRGEPAAAEAVCWWGDMEFLPHFFRLLGLRGFEARIRFAPRALRGQDRKDLARRAHALVAADLARLTPSGVEASLRAAVERCGAVLTEGAALLEKLDDELYERPGPHVRHVVEFFDALLRDLPGGWIDYDRRRRDAVLERERGAALAALRTTASRLAELAERGADPELHVRQDGSDWARSSLIRELGALHSHAIHHYSLIALLLRESGADVPADLGVAPATLAHRRRTTARTERGA
jgi:1-acyl-sn-glycerol-3-phosphate acyltransferase